MKGKQILTTARAVAISEEMLSYRREFCADTEFVRMDFVWEELCVDGGTFNIRTFRGEQSEDFKPKARVIRFGDNVTLHADERLFEDAKNGGKLSNSILAHEFAHLALDHHSNGVGVKNFQLFQGPNGMSILPPNLEEYEADLGAIFFQCGVALHDNRWDTIQLAHRAFADVNLVKKARRIAQLDVFRRELYLQRQKENLRTRHQCVVF